jgi:hypothetical protein
VGPPYEDTDKLDAETLYVIDHTKLDKQQPLITDYFRYEDDTDDDQSDDEDYDCIRRSWIDHGTMQRDPRQLRLTSFFACSDELKSSLPPLPPMPPRRKKGPFRQLTMEETGRGWGGIFPGMGPVAPSWLKYCN